MLCQFRYAILSVIAISFVAAGHAPPSHSFRIRHARDDQPTDGLQSVYNAISAIAARGEDTVTRNSTLLDTSWNDAVLFSYAETIETGAAVTALAVEITCVTCYIKGKATAEFSIEGDLNASEILSDYVKEFTDEVQNITSEVVDFVADRVQETTVNLSDGIDLDDFDIPPVPFNFQVDLRPLPQCRLRFQFDGMELYMQLRTELAAGATYTINLYSSNTPIGISLHDELRLGVVFSVDLILSAEAEITIGSGFHIKLDDGIAIDIPMFDQEVSSITFNGGDFEFLPVTIEGAGAILKAVLRVGVSAGIEIGTPDILSLASASTGVEVGVFANIAEFATNITRPSEDDDSDCDLQVIQSYQMALGVAAGASVALAFHTWGPAPETQLPIWYTTLSDACASQGPVKTSATPTTTTLRARADEELLTTTISTEVAYTGVSCLSSGLVNCPVSLQTTTSFTSMTTLITAIPSGSEAKFPETRKSTVSAIDFGPNVQKLTATTGRPKSFVPPPPTKSGEAESKSKEDDDKDDGEPGGNKKGVILGVTLGLGITILVIAIATVLYIKKRRNCISVPQTEMIQQIRLVQPESPAPGHWGLKVAIPKATAVR